LGALNTPLRGRGLRAMAKARIRSRDPNSTVPEFQDGFADSPLGVALAGDPSARDRTQVRQALGWWLEQLPASGLELAWELRAPGEKLFEAFCRGRVAVYSKGHRLQEEGDEVRQYGIVLQGRCRLRCRAPAPKTNPGSTSEVPEDDEGIDPDGCAAYDTVSAGEPLLPMLESRSPCDVSCVERTTLLLLSLDDYAATFKPYHRELQAQAVSFLQGCGVCPAGTTSQLHRLVGNFRQRCVRRGSMVMRAGELQRHVWILKSGSCSVLADPQEDTASMPEDEEESESSDESEDEVSRLERMRAQPVDAEEAQRAAAAEARNATVSKYAKGFMKKSLEARQRTPSLTARRRKGLVTSVLLSMPGLILGEEILLFEPRKQLMSRNVNTIRAEEECRFYVADVTSFRQLIMYIGVDAIAERANEKLARRTTQLGRNGKVAKRLAKQAQQLKRHEMRREDQQRIRLPPSVGYKGVDVLEDANKYLQVVFDHRKAPRNEKNPATLSVLTSLGMTPKSLDGTTSQGVGAMLRLYGDPAALKQHRAEMRWGSGMPGRRNSSASQNPMGEVIPKDADYMGAAPPSRFMIEPPPVASAQPSPPPSGGGIFFQTEPELEEREPMERSSSVPVLPRLAEPPGQEQTLLDARRPPLAHSNSWRGGSSPSGSKEVTEKPPRAEKADKKAQRLALQIMKAFHRVVPGKSILVLTDRADVRKSIMKALLSTAKEVDLTFLRSTSELWHRLRDPKEKHHAIILDLSKTELQVDGFLKCCREHNRYGNIPIVVLSSQRELSESVRSNCSFVVFHPVAVAMLREALVWCFDRRMLLANSRYDTPEMGSLASGPSTELGLEFSVTAVPVAVPAM